MILAACHSLVSVVDEKTAKTTSGLADSDDLKPVESKRKLAGDPIELAAMNCIGWSWDAETSTATPGRMLKSLEKILKASSDKLVALTSKALPSPNGNSVASKVNAEVEALKKQIESIKKKLSETKERVEHEMCTSIQVLHRHHFSSGLQRMSVVCKVELNKTNSVYKNEPSPSYFVLTKGSPEVIRSLAVPETLPPWYEDTYDRLARRGLRVLALACKKIQFSNSDDHSSILDGTSRHTAECDLMFVGFIAFECKIRADSAVVVRSLRESDHFVSMLTGDALLTSLHVARKVGICDPTKSNIVLQNAVLNNDSGKYEPGWLLRREDTDDEENLPLLCTPCSSTDEDGPSFVLNESDLHEFSQKYNLLTTEAEFFSLASMTGGENSAVWKIAGAIRVYARMSPQGKATIIRHIKLADDTAGNTHSMMCGDGMQCYC